MVVRIAGAQVAGKEAALAKVDAGNTGFEISAQEATVDRLRAEYNRQAADIQRYRA